MAWDDRPSTEVRALKGISQRSEMPSKDLPENLANLNQSVKYMSQMMGIMQGGIDDANKDIIQKIRDAIDDLLIIFGLGGGDTLSFDWGDLQIIFQHFNQIFGLPNFFGPGGIDILGFGRNFFDLILKPLGDFGNFISGAVNGFFQFLFNLLENVPFIGGFIQSIAGGMNQTRTNAAVADTKAVEAKGTAVVATNTVTYVNKIYNVRSGRPFWESGPDPTGDGTFPFNDISTYIVPGPTGGFSCGANAHSHSGLGVSYNDQVFDNVNVTSSNAPWGIIRFAGAVEKRVLTYMAMKTGQVDGLYFDIYKINPDGTASFVQSSNNEIGLIGTTMFIGQSTMPSAILVDIGDVLAVQIRVVGSGSVYFPAKKMMNYGFLPSFVPRTFSASRNPGSDPTPATIPANTMNAMYNYLIPWFTLGMDLGVKPDPRYFADQFDRGELNASVKYLLFGPNGNTHTPYLEGNQFRPRSGVAGFQGIVYPQPLVSDDWFLEWRTRADNSTQPQGAYMGDTSGNGILFPCGGGSIGASNCTGMGNGSTNARYGASIPGNFGLYRVEYNSTTKKMAYFFNNEFQGEWDDSANNWIPKGPGKRFFGLFVSNFSFGDSDWVDELTFGDIVRAA